MIYTAMDAFSAPWPSVFVYIGIILEIVQYFSLIFSPFFPWGAILRGFSKAVFFFILPFWDSSYIISISYQTNTYFFWGFFSILLLLVAVVIFQMHSSGQRYRYSIDYKTKVVIYTLWGPFFLPCMHFLLSLTVCNGATLASFHKTKCFETPGRQAILILSSICLVFLTAGKFFLTLFLYDDHPFTMSIRGRPHSVVEAYLLFFQLIFIVLFHYLPATGQREAFAGLYTLGAFLMFFVHCFYLPFFHHSVNTIRAVGFGILSYCSLVVTILINFGSQSPVYGTNWDSLIILLGSIITGIVCHQLAGLRVEKSTLREILRAVQGDSAINPFTGEKRPRKRMRFPSYLPEMERTSYVEDGNVMDELWKTRGDQSMASNLSANIRRYHDIAGSLNLTKTGSLTSPEEAYSDSTVGSYIGAIYLSTDVEVATRSIGLFHRIIGKLPSILSITFASRIYAKGLARYPSDRWLELQFATFLCASTNRTNPIALTIFERLGTYELSPMLMFHLRRRVQNVNSALLVCDHSSRKTLSSALRLHKGTLVNINNFWKGLYNDQIDHNKLGIAAASIMEGCYGGLENYGRALAENADTFAMIRYAQFLDEVLIDSDGADNTREMALDLLEKRKMGMFQDSVPTISIQQSLNYNYSKYTNALKRILIIIFLLLLIMVGAFFTYVLVAYLSDERLLRRIEEAGYCRAYMMRTLLDAVYASTAQPSDPIWVQLLDDLSKLRESHKSITYGPNRTDFPDVVAVMKEPLNAIFYDGSGVYEATGAWRAGEVFISTVETLILATTSNSARADAVSTLKANTISGAASAYNATLDSFIQAAQSFSNISQYVIIAFTIFTLFLLLSVFIAFKYFLTRISGARSSALGLFKLIPRNALKEMIKKVDSSIYNFEGPDPVFETMLSKRGLQSEATFIVATEKAVEEAARNSLSDGAIVHTTTVTNTPQINSTAASTWKTEENEDTQQSGSRFASILKNSIIADTGRVKLHQGQYEAPYPKDSFHPEKLTAAEELRRQQAIDDIELEEKLNKLKEHRNNDNTADRKHDTDENKLDGETDRSRNESRILHHAVQVILAILCLFIAITIGSLELTSLTYLQGDQETQISMGRFFVAWRIDKYRLASAAEAVAYDPNVSSINLVQNYLKRLRQTEVILRENIQNSHLPGFIESIYSEEESFRTLKEQFMAAACLACDSTQFDCSIFDSFNWTKETFVPKPSDNQWIMNVPMPEGKDVDMKKSLADRKVLSSDILMSDYYRYLKKISFSGVEKSLSLLSEKVQEKVAHNNKQHTRVRRAAVALSVFLTLFCGIMLAQGFVGLKDEGVFKLVSMLATVFSCGLLVLTIINLRDTAIDDILPYKRSFNWYYLLINFFTTLDKITDYTKLAAFSGMLEGIVYYSNHNAQNIHDQFEGLLGSIDSMFLPELTEALLQILYCVFLDGVIAKISCSVYPIFTDACNASVLANFTWDIAAETYGARKKLMFEDAGQIMYSNTNADLALALPLRNKLSKSIAFGPMRSYYISNALDTLIDVTKEYTELESGKIHSTRDRASPIAITATALAFLIALICSGRIIAAIVRRVSRIDGESNNRSAERDASFHGLRRVSTLTLIFFAIILITLASLLLANYSLMKNKNKTVDYISIREPYILQSALDIKMSVTQNWLTGSAVYFSDLSIKASESVYKAMIQNFGDQTHNLLFGSSGVTYNRYDKSTTTNRSTLDFGNLPSLMVFDNLVDLSARRWRKRVEEMIGMNQTVRGEEIDSIDEQIRTLAVNVHLSTTSTLNDIQNERKMWLIISVVLLGILITVYVCMAYFLFFPLLTRLMKEEEGTQVILRMIPPTIRNSVPAISEYMNTGLVLQDVNIYEIEEVAHELSIVPTVTIDVHGTIVRFSRAAEETFFWSKTEAIGQSVNILIPDNIAQEHDGYILRYCQTGIKKVINQTRLFRAKRKDGVIFPVKVHVREIRSRDSLVFVGVLSNCSDEIDFERANTLSRALTEASTVPLVVCDTRGIIRQFSSAAEKTFRCKGSDVIGRKVNLLMPKQEADVHDNYIEKYLRTGQITIMGGLKYVKAKRLTGEIFPAQLSLREMKRCGEIFFIGYIDDMTDRLQLELVAATSDVAKKTSPIPIIIANAEGNIVFFSDAAALTFGIPQSEALNKSISILMNEPLASQHKIYYSAYAKSLYPRANGTRTILGKGKRRHEDGSFSEMQLTTTFTDFDIHGKGRHILAFLEDASTKLQMETEVKIGECIMSLSSMPVILVNLQCEIIFVNGATLSSLGIDSETVIGSPVMRFFQPYLPFSVHETDNDSSSEPQMTPTASQKPSENCIEAAINEYARTGVSSNLGKYMKMVVISSDNKFTTLVEVMVKEVPLEDGPIFMCFIRDATDDAKLFEANRLNETLMSLPISPVVYTTLDGTVLAASDSACRRFHWVLEDLIGQNIRVLMPDSTASLHDGYLSSFRTRLENLGLSETIKTSTILNRDVMLTARTRDDQEFPVTVHVRAAHVDGSDPFLVAYLRDCFTEVELSIQKNIAYAISTLSPTPLICINSNGTVTEFSRSAEEHFGYTAADVLGRNVNILMPPEVASRHDGYLRAYKKTGVKTMVDSIRTATARKKGGSYFFIELAVKEVGQKDSIEFVGFVKDATQRQMLEQTVIVNRIVSSLVTVPVLETDKTGKIAGCSGLTCEAFGVTEEELIGSSIYTIIPEVAAKGEKDEQQNLNWLQQSLEEVACLKEEEGSPLGAASSATHRIFEAEDSKANSNRRTQRYLTGQRKDGTLFPIEVTIGVSCSENVTTSESNMKVIVYVRDLTSDFKLGLQNEINRTIIKLSPTPIISIDHQGTILIFSRAAEESFGYSAVDVEGRNVSMLMPEDIAAQHDGYLRRYKETGVKSIVDGPPRAIMAKRKDSTLSSLTLSVKETRDPEGQSVFVGYLQERILDEAEEVELAFGKTLIESSPSIFLVTDHDGRVEHFSPAAEEELAFQRLEVVGKPVGSFLKAHPLTLEGRAAPNEAGGADVEQDGMRVVDDFFAVNMKFNQGQPSLMKERVVVKRRDGTSFRADVVINSILPYRKKMPRFIAYIENIEEVLAFQGNANAANKLFEISPVALVTFSVRGVIIACNSAAEALLNYSQGDLVDRKLNSILGKLPTSSGTTQDFFVFLDKSMEGSARESVSSYSSDKSFKGATLPTGPPVTLPLLTVLTKDRQEIKIRATLCTVAGASWEEEPRFALCMEKICGEILAKDVKAQERAVLKMSDVVEVEVDMEGRFIYVSNRFIDRTGYDQDYLLGRLYQEVIPKGDRVILSYTQFALEAIRGGAAVPIKNEANLYFKRQDGFVIKFEGRLHLTTKPDGSPYSVILNMRTPRAIARKEGKLSLVATNMVQGCVLIASTRGTILRYNEAVSNLFKFSDDSFIGKPLGALIYGEPITAPCTVLRDGREFSTGNRIPLEITAREICDTFEDEIPDGFSQISSPKQFIYMRRVDGERSMRLLRKINETILDLSPDATVLISTRGNIIMFSRVAENLFGVRAEMAIDKEFMTYLLTSEDAQILRSALTVFQRTSAIDVLESPRTITVNKRSLENFDTILDTFKARMIIKERQFPLSSEKRVFIAYISQQ